MGRKSRRAASNVPRLPNEIKALVVEQLGIEGDTDTLRSLLNTSSDFAEVCRRELYRHVDFRGKSLDAVQLFTTDIAPRFSRYILSVSYAIPERDDPDAATYYGLRRLDGGERVEAGRDSETWRYYADADKTFAAALASLSNVMALTLAIPEICDAQGLPLWTSTLGALSTWKGLQHLTLRSAYYMGPNPDAFSMLSLDQASYDVAMEVLISHRNLLTLRMLDVKESGSSRSAWALKEREPPSLSNLRALQLSDSVVFNPMISVVKWGATSLTHLVLTECYQHEVDELLDLVKANHTTLTSLVIRQPGGPDWSTTDPPLAVDALPRLERLALELAGGAVSAIQCFSLLGGVSTVEIGASDEETVVDIVAVLRLPAVWPRLEKLSLTVHGEVEDWTELYELCEERKIELLPGVGCRFRLSLHATLASSPSSAT